MDESLQRYKMSIAARQHELKKINALELQKMKSKQDEARQILNKSIVPDLERPEDYLNWIECVSSLLKICVSNVSDALIANHLKGTLKNPRDVQETITMTSTEEILNLVKANYVSDKHLFVYIFKPIAELPTLKQSYRHRIIAKG